MPDTTVVVQGGAATSVVVEDAGTTVSVPASTSTNVTVPATVTNTVTAIAEQGPPGTGIYDTVHTYAVTGVLATSDFIPPFFFAKRTNQTSVLKKVIHRINSGTSVTVKLQRAPSGSGPADLTGYTGIVVTQTTTTTSQDQTLADGDLIYLVPTAVSGSPSDLTLTLVIEHTIQ